MNEIFEKNEQEFLETHTSLKSTIEKIPRLETSDKREAIQKSRR